MTREDKIEKIIEFLRQMLHDDKVDDEQLDQLYLTYKIVVETNKELKGDDSGKIL